MAAISKPNAWIRCFRPRPKANLRLFCFPYAGGGASIYRSWSQGLPTAVEVCPLQLPGREDRLGEPPLVEFSSLVGEGTQHLEPYLDMPFAFWGHSMGALLSFEFARQLRRWNMPAPVHLFVSGHRAPQLPDPDPPIHHLPEAAFLDEVRRLNGTPEAVLQHRELIKLLLPVLRADFTIVETYRYIPEEPLACGISAFGGLQDDKAIRQEIEAWREQTSHTFRVRFFPGDHFYLQSAQVLLLQVLSQELSELLNRTI